MDKAQVFKDLEDFTIDNFADDKQIYWSLHYAKNGSISKSSPRSERSFEDCGNDEAIEKLKRAIERMWNAGYKYLLVAFRDTPNDPKPLEYPIRIPTDTTQQANQIAGFQNNQNSLNNPMIGFIQAHGEVLKNAQLDLLTVKHTFEKERLNDRIEQLEAENEELRNKVKPDNFIEKIAGNPMVQAVLPSLLGKILGVEMPALAGAPNAQTTEPQDTAGAASDVEITDKQYQNLETAFALTSGVFDDADEALLQLAMWVRNNPDMARQFRNQLRGANHG